MQCKYLAPISLVAIHIAAVGHAETIDVENDSRMAQYINKRMTLTMLCEKAIGPAWYQSARAIGLVKLSNMVGMTKQEAHKMISDADKRLRNDPRLPDLQDKADPLRCMTMLNDLDFEYADIK